MTQGEKAGRGGDREAIRALDAVIFEKIEGVPWLAKHILAAIREGKVPGIYYTESPLSLELRGELSRNLDLLYQVHELTLRAEKAEKEVAELRGKVGEVEKREACSRNDAEFYNKKVNQALDELALVKAENGRLKDRIHELSDELGQCEAERDEALGLLREAAEHVSPVSHQGPTADELRAEYPEACALVDGLRARIDAFLRKSP